MRDETESRSENLMKHKVLVFTKINSTYLSSDINNTQSTNGTACNSENICGMMCLGGST